MSNPDLKSIFRAARAKRGTERVPATHLKGKRPRQEKSAGSPLEEVPCSAEKAKHLCVGEPSLQSDAETHINQSRERNLFENDEDDEHSNVSKRQRVGHMGPKSAASVDTNKIRYQTEQGTPAGDFVPMLASRLPEGFFEDVEADAKARGVKPKTKKDKEADFMEFQKSIEQDLQEIGKQEELRAQESTQHRETWEAFEQEQRLKHVENTKMKRKLATKTAMHSPGSKEVVKRSYWKMELPQITEDEGESEEEGDIIEDWRAKAV